MKNQRSWIEISSFFVQISVKSYCQQNKNVLSYIHKKMIRKLGPKGPFLFLKNNFIPDKK